MINRIQIYLFLSLVIGVFCFVQAINAQTSFYNLRFINGNWFDGKTFKKQTFYSIGGILTKKKPKILNQTIDLQNGYVIPPFGDSHTHSFDSRFLIKQQIQEALRDGVFYAKVLNNFRSGALQVKNEVNNSQSIDVQYAHGGLTSNYSHPMEVNESLSLGIYSYQQQLANTEKIWQSRIAENNAYYIIESQADLDKKWQMILDGKPDSIKVFLRNREVYAQRRNFVPKEWRRFDGEVDPKLVPIIVQKAHQAGLRAIAANNSVQDYQVAIEAKADEISHLPCYQLIDEGEKCEISVELAKLTAKNGTFITLVTSEYEKLRESKVIKFDQQNLTLLKKYRVKFALGSDSYGTTPLKGAIAMSKTGLFTNLELLKIWTENTPQTIFPNHKIGQLQKGFEANFIVLNGNPLQNFAKVQNIKFRYKQGTEILPINEVKQ